MGQPDARRTGHRKGPIRNAKEVLWEIVSVDQHGTPIIQHRKASNKRPGSKSMPAVPGVRRSVSGVPALIDPQSRPGEIGAANECYALKTALYDDKKLQF
jgi:hypothetical protein